jgi:hypothetical protein
LHAVHSFTRAVSGFICGASGQRTDGDHAQYAYFHAYRSQLNDDSAVKRFLFEESEMMNHLTARLSNSQIFIVSKRKKCVTKTHF